MLRDENTLYGHLCSLFMIIKNKNIIIINLIKIILNYKIHIKQL